MMRLLESFPVPLAYLYLNWNFKSPLARIYFNPGASEHTNSGPIWCLERARHQPPPAAPPRLLEEISRSPRCAARPASVCSDLSRCSRYHRLFAHPRAGCARCCEPLRARCGFALENQKFVSYFELLCDNGVGIGLFLCLCLTECLPINILFILPLIRRILSDRRHLVHEFGWNFEKQFPVGKWWNKIPATWYDKFLFDRYRWKH